jgi:hypothetical protein
MTYILQFPRRQQGYLLVDHTASPGLTEEQARFAGYDPTHCREGKKYETHTLRCAHCATGVVPNPFRLRERHYCAKCGDPPKYICDICAFKASMPDYVHHTWLSTFEWRPRRFA